MSPGNMSDAAADSFGFRRFDANAVHAHPHPVVCSNEIASEDNRKQPIKQ
jgi:hypothetical protein